MSVEKISDRRSKVVGPHQRKRLAVRQLGKGAGRGRLLGEDRQRSFRTSLSLLIASVPMGCRTEASSTRQSNPALNVPSTRHLGPQYVESTKIPSKPQ